MMQATPITQEIIERVQDIVREMLDERFAADEIVFDPIIVERKIDHYGDEYIDITIVFDGNMNLLDVDWRIGIIDWLHSKLESEGAYLANVIGVRFENKVEWEYLRKYGWEYVDEHGWPEVEGL